jgi:hypothetical protein
MHTPAQFRRLVSQARALLDEAQTGIEWRSATWNIARWMAKREASASARNLLFTLPRSFKRTERVPLPEPFADFAKAMVVLLWHRTRVGPDRLGVSLLALRYLFVVLERRGCTMPWQLRVEDFIDALAGYRRTGIESYAAYGFGRSLATIADEMDYFAITSVPLEFHNPISPPRVRVSLPDAAHPNRRIGGERLPSAGALAIYAECTNNPTNDEERILLRAIDLHIAMGTRIGEALTVPLDCWIEEEVRDTGSQEGRHLPNGQSLARCGIRFYPEKGYDIAVNWLADQDIPLARRAITELTTLCAEARSVAKWLEEHSGRLWDHSPDELISASQLMQYIPHATVEGLLCGMRQRRIRVARSRRTGQSPDHTLYRAGDIERAFSIPAYRLAAIAGEQGQVVLKLSDALCVKFDGQFSFVHRFRNYRRPLLVTAADINKALGGRNDQSIFDRRQMTVEDEFGRSQRIRMNAHSTRHWKNSLYDLGGMSDLEQTWAMHRKSIRQSKVYQHRTAEEQTAVMRRFLDLSFTERRNFLRSAIRNKTVAGPLADAYHDLHVNNPTKAEEFLTIHASGIHVTPWGICANDFTLAPCRKYLQCYDDCHHYHRTGDEDEQRRLEDLRKTMLTSLEATRENASGEAGSDKWIVMLEAKLANLDRALAIGPSTRQAGLVQIFPAGINRARSSVPKQSIL